MRNKDGFGLVSDKDTKEGLLDARNDFPSINSSGFLSSSPFKERKCRELQ